MVKDIQYFVGWIFVLFIFSLEVRSQSIIIDSLKQSLQEVKSTQEEVDLLYTLAEEWAELNFDSSYYYGASIFNIAENLDSDEYRVYALRAMGLAFDYDYELDTARYLYLKALEIATRTKDTTHMALINFNLGTIDLLNGNYIKVLPYYNQAIEYLERNNEDKRLLINIYNNLGIVYRRIDRYYDAIRIYQRALDVLDSEQDERAAWDVYINLGNVMISTEQFDSAEYYYRKVYDYAKSKNDLMDYAFACNGLGTVEESRNNYEKAKSYFDRVIYQEGIEDKNVIFTALRYKAEILSYQGFYDSAMSYFDRAYPIYNEGENPDQVKELYLGLAEHYERVGRNRFALEFYKKYYGLKDQLINQAVIDRTTEWEERLQAQERENEIVNLKLRNKEASVLVQQQKNQRNIFISLTIVLGLIGGFSFYMFRLKQRVNRKLEEKNEVIHKALSDKEILMKEIHHRVKNNLQVVSSLLNLQSNFITDEKATAAVRESKNRVHSMALIHQRLYQHENLTEIDLADYLDQLILNLEQSYRDREKKISLDFDADQMMMDVDKVVLLGLIVNELVTNCYKYAFENRQEGTIKVALKKDKEKIILSVKDNGKGMISEPKVKKGSLGTLLINDLSKKLNGKIEYIFDGGTEVLLTFNYPKSHL